MRDRKFTERVYDIVKRVALDSCNAFSVQIAGLLSRQEMLTAGQLATATNLPSETIMARLDDMRRLGSVETTRMEGGGTPQSVYRLTEALQLFWKEAHINSINGHKPHIKEPTKQHGVIKLNGKFRLRK